MLFKSFALQKFAQTLSLFFFLNDFWFKKNKKWWWISGSNYMSFWVHLSIWECICNGLSGWKPWAHFVPMLQEGNTACITSGCCQKTHWTLIEQSCSFHKRVCCDPGIRKKYREQKHRLMFAFCRVAAGGILSTCSGCWEESNTQLGLGTVCYCALLSCGIPEKQTNQI